MKTIRTFIAWVGALFIFLFLALLIMILPVFIAPRYWERPVKFLCRGITSCFGYKVRIQGLEKLPSRGAMILICNHVNLLDPFLLFGHLPLSFRALEQLQHFSWPIYGPVTKRFGNIPLDQSGGGRTATALRSATKALESGTSLIIFPEGHRTRDGHFLPFKRGAFRLAIKTGIPLVPVVQRGSWDVLQTGSPSIQPGLVELILLHPRTQEDWASLREGELRGQVKEMMEKIYKKGLS